MTVLKRQREEAAKEKKLKATEVQQAAEEDDIIDDEKDSRNEEDGQIVKDRHSMKDGINLTDMKDSLPMKDTDQIQIHKNQPNLSIQSLLYQREIYGYSKRKKYNNNLIGMICCNSLKIQRMKREYSSNERIQDEDDTYRLSFGSTSREFIHSYPSIFT